MGGLQVFVQLVEGVLQPVPGQIEALRQQVVIQRLTVVVEHRVLDVGLLVDVVTEVQDQVEILFRQVLQRRVVPRLITLAGRDGEPQRLRALVR